MPFTVTLIEGIRHQDGPVYKIEVMGGGSSYTHIPHSRALRSKKW